MTLSTNPVSDVDRRSTKPHPEPTGWVQRWASRRGTLVALNLAAPGVGLILLRRERFGVAVALAFIFFVQAWLWGWLMVPAIVQPGVSAAAAITAALIWVVSQWIVWRRASTTLGGEASHNVEMLVAGAVRALAETRLSDAESLLSGARTIDDENIDVLALWAHLLALKGQLHEARDTWIQVERLDQQGQYRREVALAVDKLPAAPLSGARCTTKRN